MKSTKETKSVQTPLYALTKGSGKFGAGQWQCTKCGEMSWCGTNPAKVRPAQDNICPAGGKHVWVEL